MSTIRRSLFFSLVERHTAFAIQFISNIVIARLLTPAEIGVYSTSAALLALMYVVREFGISAFIIQERELTEAKIRTAFGLMILLSWPIAVLVWLGSNYIASWYGQPEIGDILSLMAVNFIILPFGQPARGLLNREMRFRSITLIDVSSGFAHAVSAIAFSWYGYGPISLAYASVIGTSVTVAITLWYKPRHVRLLPTLSNWREILSFGSYATAASVISTAGASSAELVIGKVLDFASVGLYSRAVGLVSLLQSQLPVAFARVALPGFAQMIRAGKQLEQPYVLALGHITGVLWPAYVFIALAAEPLIGLLFGEQWIGAVAVAQILCFAGAVNATVFLIHSVYNACGMMTRRFVSESIAQSIRIGVTLAAAPFGLEAVAVGQVLTAAISGLVYYIIAQNFLRITWVLFLQSIWRSAVVSGFTAASLIAASMALNAANEQYVVHLTVYTFAGGFGWCLGLALTRHVLGAEIRGIIQPRLFQFITACRGGSK